MSESKFFNTVLRFRVNLDKLNLTPGSGELPEEIYRDQVAAEGRNTNLTTLRDEPPNREYLLTAQVEAPDNAAALEYLMRYFQHVPGIEILEQSAQAGPSAGSGDDSGAPTASSPSPSESPPTFNYRATIHFVTLKTLPEVQAALSHLPAIVVTANGLKEFEFFARFDVDAAEGAQPVAVAEKQLFEELELSGIAWEHVQVLLAQVSESNPGAKVTTDPSSTD